MVISIKQTFLSRVRSSVLEPWLDDETRKRAIRKLSNMPHTVGIPRQLLDATFLTDFYDDLLATDLSATNLLFNAMVLIQSTNRALFRFVYDRPISKLYLIVSTDFTDVNAYYLPSFNEMIIPMGIMDLEQLSATELKAVHYGTLGMIIGHEITHGFDDQGIRYDE